MAEHNARNPNVERAAKALGAGALPLAEVAGEKAGPPANPSADQCTTCGRLVNLAEPVSHAMRGLHTCATTAGTIPPYLDPRTDAERGATVLYHQRRREQRATTDQVAGDPLRPF